MSVYSAVSNINTITMLSNIGSLGSGPKMGHVVPLTFSKLEQYQNVLLKRLEILTTLKTFEMQSTSKDDIKKDVKDVKKKKKKNVEKMETTSKLEEDQKNEMFRHCFNGGRVGENVEAMELPYVFG